MANKKVFLDSSVIITALLSAKGGSFYVITNYKSHYDFFISEYVLAETRDVLRRKFSQRKELGKDLFLLIGLAGIAILPNPPAAKLKPLSKIIEPADTPILASAIAECDYLLTLDQDFLTDDVKSFAQKKNTTIMTPGELIHNTEKLGNLSP